MHGVLLFSIPLHVRHRDTASPCPTDWGYGRVVLKRRWLRAASDAGGLTPGSAATAVAALGLVPPQWRLLSQPPAKSRDGNIGELPESLPSPNIPALTGSDEHDAKSRLREGATAYCGRIGIRRATPRGMHHRSGAARCVHGRQCPKLPPLWRHVHTSESAERVTARRPSVCMCALETWPSPRESRAPTVGE